MTLLACAGALVLTLLPLLAMGVQPDYAALVEQLKSPDAEAVQAAEKALLKAGAPAVPAMVRAAVKEPLRQERMATRLNRMGPKAVPALLPLLADPQLKTFAGSVLFQVIGPDSAGEAPQLLACGKDPVVGNYCGQALVKAMSPKAKGQVGVLAAALKDPDPALRMYAALALGMIGPKAKAAVPALAAALKEPGSAARRAAASALGKLGPAAKAAIPALKALSTDSDAAVRDAAEQALRSVTSG